MPAPTQTATTHAARDHARSMHGTVVTTMPTMPPSAAVDLPVGVSGDDVLWDEVVAGGNYTALTLPRGAHLGLTDLEGEACAGLLLHRADRTAERLCIADTTKVQWQAYLGEGSLLLSDMGRVLAAIVADTSGRHDALCGTSNLAANVARYGDGAIDGPSPCGRDLFALSLTKSELSPRDVAPNLNLFKHVTVADDGSLRFTPEAEPMARVVLRCEMDVLVTIVNVPHPVDRRDTYTVGPLRVTAWRGAPAAPADPIRNATPEGLRAYLNTEAAVGATVPRPTPGGGPE